jgi:hypothetical protein
MPVEKLTVYSLEVTVHKEVLLPPIVDENNVLYGYPTPPDNRRWMLGVGKFSLGYFRDKSEAESLLHLLNQHEALYESMVTVEIVEYDISVLDLYQSKVEVDTFYGEGCINADSELVFNFESALIFLG